MSLLQVKNLIVEFPSRRGNLRALDDISFDIAPGEILGVVGELGAGKTHLTQGIMEGLGSSEAAASPTFSLVHEHADGRLPACHFDFYRLKDESELIGIGWEEYLDGETVLIVEWANLFPEALPEETSWLLLEHEGSCLRRVSLAPAE